MSYLEDRLAEGINPHPEAKEFEKYLSDAMMMSPDDMAFQINRNCYKEYWIHFAWAAWKARAKLEQEPKWKSA